MCAFNPFAKSFPYLLIDCHGLLHAIRYAQCHFVSATDKEYHLVSGFLNVINDISYRFGTGNLVFAWDSTRSLRKEKYPFYKERRYAKERTPEEVEMDKYHFAQFAILRDEVIPTIGFVHNHIYEGFEADDIIAATVLNNTQSMIIVSSDEDLYQLLGNANMYIYRKKSLFSAQGFKELYGISPEDWWKVKAIAGCASDCIPGVPGIGEKFAIKYLRGELTGARLEKIKAYKEKVDENEWLVRLPLQTSPACPVPDLKYQEGYRSMDGFIAMLTKYNVVGFTEDRLRNIATRWRLK